MICALIDTSSAETGSSSTMSRVCVASARAIAIRWRCPPLNSCGNSRATSGSSPTSPRTSATRLTQRIARKVGVNLQRSATMSPTLMRGLSEL